jgi:DNA-binding LacI/PurR family transcriptional regulator
MDILSNIHVNPGLEAPLVLQIKEQLLWMIASGQLKPGDHLPSIRRAAKRLGVNMHTVRSAYLRLADLELVEIHQGAPVRVLAHDPQRLFWIDGGASSHMVGIIIPNLANLLFTEYIRGVEAIARPEHTLLLVCDAHDEPEEAVLYLRKLIEKRVDGILAFSFGLTEHLPTESNQGDAAKSFPLVTVDWSDEPGYNVLCDHENGAYQAVAHLIAHGHRRVGLIVFALDIPIVQSLHAGYQRALAEAGIELNPHLIAPVYGFMMDAGKGAAQALLRLPNPPTAILAISDLVAIGAMEAIRAAGLRVPEDIALASINDILLARLVDPPLTTVHMPAFEMGQAAMEMLKSLIAGDTPPQRSITVPTTLVIRQSCGEHQA